MTDLPLIGITMGDPSGIGPEIIVKALSHPEIHGICRPVVIGDPTALALSPGAASGPVLREILDPSEARGLRGTLEVIPRSRLHGTEVIPGSPSIEGGRAMMDYITHGVDLANSGKIAALVTCPINKALMQSAGYPFEGHTPFIAQLTRTEDAVMMLAGDRLRVALVTVHCRLKDVPSLLSVERILKTTLVTLRALRHDFGIPSPRVAVAALNPHAGEAGLFGYEEEEIIAPAVRLARQENWQVEGPLPADTVFHLAVQGRFDAVISMYHDQGLAPLKLLHFSNAVNITLGLPIVRTSVDHGTAYDIAGKGTADPSSLLQALHLAAGLALNRARRAG